MRSSERRSVGYWAALVATVIGSLVVIAIGGILVFGGVQLVGLGGSFYYLLAGAGLVAAGILLALKRSTGGVIFAAVLLATLIWSIWEAGLAFWPLLPRVFSPAVIGILVLLILLGLPKTDRRKLAMMTTGLGVVLGFVLMAVSLFLQFSVGQAKAPAQPADPAAAVAAAPTGDWKFYGRDPGGTRFAPFTQITKANVGELKEAWRIRTGDLATGGSEDQNTPTQVGDTVYLCTPKNIVIAVDADTGKQKWRHDPQIKGGGWNRCRGVGYYATASVKPVVPAAATTPAPAPAAAPAAPAALCARRIINTTIDARIFALDADTGQLCPNFGEGGVVNLGGGMGEIKRGFYFPTSAPTIARGMIIIGGWVQDNTELNEPSGVVRAFSAETGELVWAWDLGNPAITKLPPEGQTYTRGTPNVWSTPAFDDQLGLVYLPTGNATPDYWGSHRSDIADQYNSAVVALDISTGRERWKYQTVHHDIWDYDVPSQPMLIEFPDGKGGKTPALIQLTKRGQIFVLDRRTGQPISRVVETPTPQNPEKGEWVTPTQPYSVDMPTIGAGMLKEANMWGVTPIDQMMCRIDFKKVRYEGEFTPPGIKPNLQYPGNAGGQNWGSGSYDAVNNYLIVSDIRMAITVALVPSKRPNMQLNLAPNRSAKGANAIPYQSRTGRFMSKLEVPCTAPPHGTLSAVDLNTRKIVWQVPLGTAENSAPLGGKSGLKIPTGTPGPAGSIATAGGLVFHAATTDYYMRAYDSATGKVLWASPMPVGAGATPMSYVSPKTGKQYVLISAGGARRMPERGDYVIAYALPN